MTEDSLNAKRLAKYIDHTCLKPEATESEILRTCDEAIAQGFYSVCVEARWLPVVVPKLKLTSVKPITVISFPGGNASTAEKVSETKRALEAGAQEIDMVLNRDLMKARDYQAVQNDIEAVVRQAENIPVKVILETSELNDAEKAVACALAKIAGAAFVKTSTGFSKSGATVADIRLMRGVVGPGLGVKASGGVRSYSDAAAMIEAGATRLGTSASVAIVQGIPAGAGNY